MDEIETFHLHKQIDVIRVSQEVVQSKQQDILFVVLSLKNTTNSRHNKSFIITRLWTDGAVGKGILRGHFGKRAYLVSRLKQDKV